MKERNVLYGPYWEAQRWLEAYKDWEIAQAFYGNQGENILLIMEREVEENE